MQGIPRSAPSTSLAFDDPNEVLRRKRGYNVNNAPPGTSYQPNGASLPQPTLAQNLTPQAPQQYNQPQPSSPQVPQLPTATPDIPTPTTAGSLAGQLATNGTTATATPRVGVPTFDTWYANRGNDGGTWQGGGTPVFRTNEEANAGWIPQTESPLWWQLGGLNRTPPATVDVEEEAVPEGHLYGERAGEDSLARHAAVADEQARIRARLAAEAASASSATPPPTEAPRPVGTSRTSLTSGIGSQGAGLQLGDPAIVAEDTGAPSPPDNDDHIASSHSPASEAYRGNWYTQHEAEVRQWLTNSGADASTIELALQALRSGRARLVGNKIWLSRGEGSEHWEGGSITSTKDWPDDILDSLTTTVNRQAAASGHPNVSPEDANDAKRHEILVDFLKSIRDLKGTGQISPEATEEELKAQRAQRALEQGRGTWAAMELAANTGVSPEATQGVVADISQKGAIQGQAIEAQTRLQREMFNAQREQEWAGQMQAALAFAASQELDPIRRGEMLNEAKELAKYSQKLGIQVLQIQDRLATPTAGEWLGAAGLSVLGAGAKAITGKLFGG